MSKARRMPDGREPKGREKGKGLGAGIKLACGTIRGPLALGTDIPPGNRCLPHQPQNVEAGKYGVTIKGVRSPKVRHWVEPGRSKDDDPNE